MTKMEDLPGWSARKGIVVMSWDRETRHTVPVGTTWAEFNKTSVMYSSYWTLHNSKPCNHVCGSGRPFAAVCLNAECGQQLEKMTTVVDTREERFHANTPVLGWCACICCKRCVMESPVIDGQWRECPGCGYDKSHRHTYLMYPLTWEGETYNIQLGKEIKKRYSEMEK